MLLWPGHADMKNTKLYLRASPAEKLEILGTNTPPSIRSGTFPGVKDSLMRVLGGHCYQGLMPSESAENGLGQPTSADHSALRTTRH